MKDLSHHVPPRTLTPSSMSAGNTVQDDATAALTAPGSQSVSPVPDAMDHLVNSAHDSAPHGRTTLIGAGGSPDPAPPASGPNPDLAYQAQAQDYPPWQRV